MTVERMNFFYPLSCRFFCTFVRVRCAKKPPPKNTAENIRKIRVLLNSTCLFLAQGSFVYVCVCDERGAPWSFCTLVTGPCETTRTAACGFFFKDLVFWGHSSKT